MLEKEREKEWKQLLEYLPKFQTISENDIYSKTFQTYGLSRKDRRTFGIAIKNEFKTFLEVFGFIIQCEIIPFVCCKCWWKRR